MAVCLHCGDTQHDTVQEVISHCGGREKRESQIKMEHGGFLDISKYRDMDRCIMGNDLKKTLGQVGRDRCVCSQYRCFSTYHESTYIQINSTES